LIAIVQKILAEGLGELNFSRGQQFAHFSELHGKDMTRISRINTDSKQHP
jgi:hypothetical protein